MSTQEPPDYLDSIQALTGSRYDAHCGRCMRGSVPVPATTPASAWEQLKAIGWTWYVSEYGGRGYPECPTCTKGSHSVEDAAHRAKRSRKRR